MSKISQLTQLAQAVAAAKLPVSLNGENYSLSVQQILAAAPKTMARFGGFRTRPLAVLASGYTSLSLPIVWDTIRKRFFAEYVSGSSVSYYTEWNGSTDFMDGEAVREDAVFASAEGGLYMYSSGDLKSYGISDTALNQISLNTPIIVTDEELAALKQSGQIVAGQIYCTAE